ncbi:MAG: MFS transporter [Bacteroidota bacterium]
MSEPATSITVPKDRIPFGHKVAYGLGGFVNNMLATASSGMMIILNLGFGMNPALVGLLGALPRITDAFTDPIVGYISDTTSTKWGRRRPYIFWGAIASGVIFALLWQIPRGWSETAIFIWFLVGSILFYLAYTVYATPWVALGFELTPDYNERTRVMGYSNFFQQPVNLIAPWFLWFVSYEVLFDTQAEGARWLAIAVGVVVVAVGVIPAIVLREPMKAVAAAEVPSEARASLGEKMKAFFAGVVTTFKSRPFLLLCIATFLVFNGFILIAAFQSYVIIYYIFGGDEALGAEFVGYAGTTGAIAGFAIVVFSAWLGTRIGKRKSLMVCLAVSVVGYVSKWFAYDPANPWLLLLPAPLMAFGFASLFTLVPAMVADVVDVDELETHERREGTYGSIYWWFVKVGLAAALAAGGVLLNATGFDVDLGSAQSDHTLLMLRVYDVAVPAVTSLVAIWAVWKFPITEATAREVRDQLEARRGTAGAG